MDFVTHIVTAVLCVVVIHLSLLAAKEISYRRSIRGRLPLAPEEEASWWLGHQYRVASHQVGAEYSRWARLLGPVYRIKAALRQRDVIIVTDHYAIKHIFAQAYTYVKSPELQGIVTKVLGKGLIWADGDEHKFQRKMVAPAFAASATKKMAPALMTVTDRLIQRLQNGCDDQGCVVNLSTYIPGATLEMIGKVGFGYDFSPESPDGKAILDAWTTDVQLFSSFAAFLLPFAIGAFPWIAKLPIKALHEETTARKVIHRVGRKLLAEPSSSEGTNIFSILCRVSWQGSSKSKQGDERKLDDNTLLDNILTFFIAGFETTSGTVQFILLDLARRPEVQTKLREELVNANTNDVSVMEALPYLDAVVREGIRLNQISQEANRVAVQDDVIPLKKQITLQDGRTVDSLPVKAGDVITIPITPLNTDPAVWGPDSDLFKPERWLTEGGVPPAESLPHGPFSHLSNFIDGPRVCIGWRLAVQETKVMVAAVVKAFELRDLGVKIDRRHSPTVQPFVHGKAAQLPVHMTPIHY